MLGAVSLNPSVATVLAVAYAMIGGGDTKASIAWRLVRS